MRIALLSEKYTPDLGGLAISTERLARLLTSAGHTVRVFAPTSNLPASEKRTLPSSGVSVTRFGAHKRVDDTLVDWFELIVAEHSNAPFDILQAYFLPQAGFVAAYAGKYLGVPSVVSIRGNDIERAAFDPAKFSQVMYALQHASAVTTNASELAKKAKAFLDREITLIPNGIDTNLFRPMTKNQSLKQALGLGDMPIIGFVGELREKKGLTTLLAGYTKICKIRPCALLIVGEVREGEDRKAFEEFRNANPQLQIVVTGPIPHKDMPAYYSLMDVFVHPSLRDGLPNALLEAMACGKAVVATPAGGTLDVVQDGVDGKLIPVGSADALAATIEELISDAAQRVRFENAAQKMVTKKGFTPERELNATLELYRELGVLNQAG